MQQLTDLIGHLSHTAPCGLSCHCPPLLSPLATPTVVSSFSQVKAPKAHIITTTTPCHYTANSQNLILRAPPAIQRHPSKETVGIWDLKLFVVLDGNFISCQNLLLLKYIEGTWNSEQLSKANSSNLKLLVSRTRKLDAEKSGHLEQK